MHPNIRSAIRDTSGFPGHHSAVCTHGMHFDLYSHLLIFSVHVLVSMSNYMGLAVNDFFCYVIDSFLKFLHTVHRMGEKPYSI